MVVNRHMPSAIHTLSPDCRANRARCQKNGVVGGQLPLNFQRYSQADQQRIAARMVTVLAAVQQGIALETGPFPAQDVALQGALETIKHFNSATA